MNKSRVATIKNPLFLLIFGAYITFATANAATTYKVQDFSPEYHATVTIDGNLKDVFLPGTVKVYSKKQTAPLITVHSNELTLDLEQGKVKANVQELPYGEQSLLIYDDFNFDGRKDLAIMDGQNSCYHGPSFQIYLASAKGFVFSSDFTRLSQDYCGMFATDKVRKHINVMTKDGCCWHQYEEYSLLNNKPYLQHQMVIQAGPLPFYIQEDNKIRQGKGFKSITTYSLDYDATNSANPLILAFSLRGKYQRRVYILKDDDNMIDYLLVDGDGTVELGARLADHLQYPNSKEGINVMFLFEAGGNRLSFVNKGVTYTVIDTPTRLGVEVVQNGKTTFLPGVFSTKKGGLQQLGKLVIQNMAYGK